MPPRTRAGTKLAAKLSSCAVFDTAELLEMNLLQLPVKDLLLDCRVCKQWKSAIDSSHNIQTALFKPLTTIFNIDSTKRRSQNNETSPVRLTEVPFIADNRFVDLFRGASVIVALMNPLLIRHEKCQKTC